MTDEAPEQLMNALISKMETMDADIQNIRAENLILKNTLDNPQVILRKAGFVSYGTPLSEDVEAGVFRGDLNTTDMDFMLKEDGSPDKFTDGSPDKFTNTQIHEMSWDEIHDMADQHREVKEMF